MLSKEVSSTIFKVFGMTQPGIEPRSPGPLANILPTRPMSRLIQGKELCPPLHFGAVAIEKGAFQ